MKKRKKGSFAYVLLVIFLVAGLSLLLYPSFSNWWNTMHTTRAMLNYDSAITDLSDDTTDKLISQAVEYNKQLLKMEDRFFQTTTELEQYNSLLNPVGDGMLGYIEIAKINVSLPIYHSTSEAVLAAGVGHIEGSSLPVGGKGTHCALSGHRGLPSARLFSDLDVLTEGDTFVIHTLDRVFTYQVDQIHIVEPGDIRDLAIDKDKDYCTLVTCTPYGVNSHRMMVRGVRIENEKGVIAVTSDAIQIEPKMVALFVAVPILLCVFVIIAISSKRKASYKKAVKKLKE